MKKTGENLFQIGEVVKILGITRKTLLVYEEAGLVTPAVKDKESGYRYYSADNMVQIRAIRNMQSLGLSLREIGDYYYDTEHLDKYLERLLELRSALDKNIHLLQFRAAKPGDLTIRKTVLPHQVCFCRRYLCADPTEAMHRLRETYIDAAHTGKMEQNAHMFTVRMSKDPEELDVMCCIPVEDGFVGPERVELPEMPAFCIYFRGPYEVMATAMRALAEHLKENGIEAAGPFRCTYLEGPPNRRENSADYITQVAVPVKY